MAGKKQTKTEFTFAPQRKDHEVRVPEDLSIVDYPAPKTGRKLGGGAYDPYESNGGVGDTARVRKPRVDLRKLSEWIKTTQQVKALREQELPPDTDLPPEK